jgi:spoIIIJ-associated protein
MLKKVEFEAKSLAEAERMSSEMLRIQPEKIKLTVLKEKKGLLGIGASATYEATPNINVALEGKTYLEGILQSFGVDAKMELRTVNDGSEIYYHVESDHNAILIGREGRTLLAIQFMLRNYLNIFLDENIVISLDIGNYNENRRKQLEILATKTAKEVAYSHIAVKLDPMNAFDRRIIHTKLAEWRDVTTESEGEGDERALVIRPVKR